MQLPEQYHFHHEAFGGKNEDIVIRGQTFRSKTLDDFVTEFKTPYIDILKIDTEGAELNGIYRTDADSIWTQNKIGQIFVEIHVNFNDADTFRRLFDLFDFFVSHGFVLFHSVRTFLNLCIIYLYILIIGIIHLCIGMECECFVGLGVCVYQS